MQQECNHIYEGESRNVLHRNKVFAPPEKGVPNGEDNRMRRPEGQSPGWLDHGAICFLSPGWDRKTF
jgi:hypothetical protein